MVEREARLVTRLVALKERLAARQVEIVAGDAMTVAARLAPGAFDIVFLDPPFESGLLGPALECMRTLLAPAGLVYAESGARSTPNGRVTSAWKCCALARRDASGSICCRRTGPE